MKDKKDRETKKRVKTGSIALRIALASAFDLVLAFFVVDAVLLLFEAWPQADLSSGMQDGFLNLLSACKDLLSSSRFRTILDVEGILVLLRLILDMFRVRRQLRPLDEIAQAAMDLSRIDVAADERFQMLEDAIDRLTPAAEGEALSTGDKELEGLESAVNKLMDRMRESYRQQARFVSDASHELRTPIAVIKGYADMLDRWGKEDDAILEESIQAIRTESENMQHLVEQLLFLARGDSGRTPVEKKDFSLTDMMAEVHAESAMIDEGHVYVLDAPEEVTVRGDASLLKQTARILVENAKKYSPEGSEIRLSVKRQDGRPCFSVEDRGIGIEADALPHVFERFYRADDSRARGSGGTGLGLAIAKWIVDRHGGHFEVVTRKDVGTRITVVL